MQIKPGLLLMAVCICGCLAACKQEDDPPAKNLLECPADPAPVRGFGGKGNVFLPNAFSPNGDGRNDVLRLVASDAAATRSVTMRIVDAAGKVLFTFSRQSDAWDGYDHHAGRSFPAGRYRVDYGIVMHGGTGTDVALSGHTCVTLYESGANGCLKPQGLGGNVFEDQVDPALGTAPWPTSEKFCQ